MLFLTRQFSAGLLSGSTVIRTLQLQDWLVQERDGARASEHSSRNSAVPLPSISDTHTHARTVDGWGTLAIALRACAIARGWADEPASIKAGVFAVSQSKPGV